MISLRFPSTHRLLAHFSLWTSLGTAYFPLCTASKLSSRKNTHSTKWQFYRGVSLTLFNSFLLHEQVYYRIRACITHCPVCSVRFEDRGRSSVILGKCGAREREVRSHTNWEGTMQIGKVKSSALSYLGGKREKRRSYLRSSMDLISRLTFLLQYPSNGTPMKSFW